MRTHFQQRTYWAGETHISLDLEDVPECEQYVVIDVTKLGEADYQGCVEGSFSERWMADRKADQDENWRVFATVDTPIGKFQYILDTVPPWFREIPNVQIDVSSTIVIIPKVGPVVPGDWIIRDRDGRIRTETCEDGRVKARAMLIQTRQDIAREMRYERGCAND